MNELEQGARIAEIDRQVETEPNLDKRVEILKAALEHYPREPHFEQSMRLTREKRDLVNAIVAKARLQEERGQFSDALAQWEILRTIYSEYPGLSFEVERLEKRRAQHLRSEAKARLVDQIDLQMAACEYRRAGEVLQEAQADFPDDAELAGLERLIKQGMERTGEALSLMARGQEMLAQGQVEGGLKALRRAHRHDAANPVIRRAFLDILLERAQAVMEQDWRAAEPLLQEALELDPNHALAKSLQTLAQDRQRQESVDQIVARARRSQGEGNLSGALAQVKNALASHGSDPRLTQFQTTLSRELQETQRRQQSRRRDLEDLRRLGKDAEAASNPAALKLLVARMESISQRYRNDAEFESAVREIRSRVAAWTEAFEKPTAQAAIPSQNGEGAVPAATVIASGENGKPIPSGTLPRPAQRQPGATEASPAVAPTLKAPPKPMRGIEPSAPTFAQLEPGRKKGRSTRWRIVEAAAIAIAVGGILIVPQLWKKRSATTTSAGAASSPAPTPLARTVTPPPSPPQALRVEANLEHGEISLDGNPAVPLEGGQFNLDDVASGKHALAISAGPSRALVDFEIVPDSPPQVIAPVQATGMKAVVISNMGDTATIHSSYGPVVAILDGRWVGRVGSTPLPLKNLKAGTHELVLGSGKDARKLAVEISPAPSLAAHFSADQNVAALLVTTPEKDARKSAVEIAPAPSPAPQSRAGRNVGALLITTGEDDVTVLLNGKKYPQTTKRGQLLIANLEPNTYGVAVQKDGFQDLAPQQTKIEKGKQAKLAFVLQPIPTLASLRVEGAPAAAQVMLDGNLLGTVQPDGTFSASNLKPGDHTVELRKEEYRPKKLTRRFAAGELVHLAGSDVSLESAPRAAEVVPTPLPAKLVVETLPGAQVSLDGRAAGQANSQGRLEVDQLTPGQHAVQVALTGFQDYKQSVSLLPGGSTTFSAGLLYVIYVVHRHPVGSCSGTLIAGRGRIEYRATSGNHSFDQPSSEIKDLGPAHFENAFYIEMKGAKRFFFRSASPDYDLRMVRAALGQH